MWSLDEARNLHLNSLRPVLFTGFFFFFECIQVFLNGFVTNEHCFSSVRNHMHRIKRGSWFIWRDDRDCCSLALISSNIVFAECHGGHNVSLAWTRWCWVSFHLWFAAVIPKTDFNLLYAVVGIVTRAIYSYDRTWCFVFFPSCLDIDRRCQT